MGVCRQAGYVGSRTVRPLLAMELNYALPGGGNAGRILNQQFGRTASTSTSASVCRWDRAIRFVAGDPEPPVQRRLLASDKLHVLESMSWGTSWMDPSQFHRNRALSSFDRPHNLVVGWVADLPFGEGKPFATEGLAKILFGGWQLNGISQSTVARRLP